MQLSGLARSVKVALIEAEGKVSRAEFYLSNLETQEELQLCMPPEEVSVRTETSFRSYNIIERGEVAFPKGERLERISWRGTLPGARILHYPFVTHEAWDRPADVIDMLKRWRGDKLRLLITQTPLNLDVFLKDFAWEAAGGQGHFKYNVEFVAAKDLAVLTVEEADAERAAQSELKSRPHSKSKLGQRISKFNNIWAVTKILTGKGSLADVEKVAGGTSLDDFQFGDILWG